MKNNSQPKNNLSEEQVRRQKLEQLIAKNKNPFLNSFFPRQEIGKIVHQNKNQSLTDSTQTKLNVHTAGRIIQIRHLGKIMFFQLIDQGVKIQLLINAIHNPQMFATAKTWDRGDIIGIESGQLMKTHTGELTIEVEKACLLVKALLPLPDKFHGLKDQELKYRKRYLDLLMNNEARQRFQLRSQIIDFIRHYLVTQNYLEVTTPILQSVLGGAAAKPFVTHHRALDINLYLRVAPELYLKKLVVGGFNRVFEIGRVFRNEGLSPRHNPEFTILEVYQAYGNIKTMMSLTEKLITEIADQIFHTRKFTFKQNQIDLSVPFVQMTMIDAVQKFTQVNFDEIKSFAEAQKLAQKNKVPLDKFDQTIGHVLNRFFEFLVQPELTQPTFIYNYPIEISPFAKRSSTNPNFTERFELFIVGDEYANAFSELNDPIDQRQRLEKQLAERIQGNEEANELDEEYLEALAYGLPPTGGMGLGVDRLIMFFTNTESIKDVILFPTLRPINN